MDILHLVDRLEELFNESRAVPMTNNVIVDEDQVLKITDQMRISIPDEVKGAQQILSERDIIRAKAEEEAERTISIARKKGEEALAENTITVAAKEESDRILNQAKAEAITVRQEADDYVVKALSAFEEELKKLLNQTRKGIQDHTAERQQKQTESTEAEKSQEPEEFESPEATQG